MKSGPILPPWMFHHQELLRSMASADYLDQQKLTNIFNYLHFKGDPVYSILNHPQYEESLLIKIYPEPCSGEVLNCRWDDTYASYKLEKYRLQFLIISHDQSFIVVPARLISRNGDSFTVELPKTAFVINRRQFPRFDCRDVKAELWQNGFHAEGELVDFSPQAFRLRLQSDPAFSFHCFNSEETATIRLSGENHVFYSGICSCRRANQNGCGRELVLTPIQNQIKRFKAKTLRNPRRCPSPPFYAVFEHPFTRKKIQREISDISTSGIAIEDRSSEALLMPGMIIPEMIITYAGILKIPCKVQVIYRKDEELVRFGLVILDMDLKDYNAINQLLNSNSGVGQDMSSEIDLDELWDLFFDTNFMYPAKYQHIHKYKDDFLKTYRKLYSSTQEIAKHFTYQRNGRIYSHVSLLRAYEKAWMIHHHAARPLDEKYTGLIVLKQLIFYLNDAHHLPSANMDYVFCYVRPENKYNERLYAGFSQTQNDASVTSLDLFSYLLHEMGMTKTELPDGWSLRECNDVDLWELHQYYEHHSGGLLWNMIFSKVIVDETIEDVYSRLGFIRKWKFMAIHFLDVLKAVIIREESDVAINLSDLMNGFKVFVMDPEVPPEVIFTAIENLSGQDHFSSMPVMIYPDQYPKDKGLNIEKQYYLWILDMQHGNEFMKYLGQTYRIKLG